MKYVLLCSLYRCVFHSSDLLRKDLSEVQRKGLNLRESDFRPVLVSLHNVNSHIFSIQHEDTQEGKWLLYMHRFPNKVIKICIASIETAEAQRFLFCE